MTWEVFLLWLTDLCQSIANTCDTKNELTCCWCGILSLKNIWISSPPLCTCKITQRLQVSGMLSAWNSFCTYLQHKVKSYICRTAIYTVSVTLERKLFTQSGELLMCSASVNNLAWHQLTKKQIQNYKIFQGLCCVLFSGNTLQLADRSKPYADLHGISLCICSNVTR